jgi:hypothetical protein
MALEIDDAQKNRMSSAYNTISRTEMAKLSNKLATHLLAATVRLATLWAKERPNSKNNSFDLVHSVRRLYRPTREWADIQAPVWYSSPGSARNNFPSANNFSIAHRYAFTFLKF